MLNSSAFKLKRDDYQALAKDKTELLKLIREVEIIEEVFHSNAIENSTLTLDETERILLEMDIAKIRNVREINEAQNLARVYKYIEKENPEINLDSILLCHHFLLDNINEEIAGRIRRGEENVRVGKHIAPEPIYMEPSLDDLLKRPIENFEDVIRFHIDFEHLHPFIDGNGRIGRVIINWQLKQLSLPPIIIQSDTKVNQYYPHLANTDYDSLINVCGLLLSQSINKRLTYFDNKKIITLAQYAKTLSGPTLGSLINKANRQSIPAFRMGGHWRIGAN